METKVCKSCKKEKEINCFQKIKNIPTKGLYTCKDKVGKGYRNTCIKCMNDTCTKSYIERNKENFYSKMKISQTNHRLSISDVFIKGLMRHNFGISAKLVTEDMIVLKRKEYELRKELRQNNY